MVRDYLTQVVLNLVLNAIDATDDQGRIHLEAQVEDGWLVLSVEDDGRGISLADRCRLFQPFFTTKPHGTGLGLFVSRQILEEFSGTLAYRSEPGQGSTFIVRLPWEAADLTDRVATDRRIVRLRRGSGADRPRIRCRPASARHCRSADSRRRDRSKHGTEAAR